MSLKAAVQGRPHQGVASVATGKRAIRPSGTICQIAVAIAAMKTA